MPRGETKLATRTGRPSVGDFSDVETGELTDEGMSLVRKAAGLGLTKAHIARLLGMHPDTFFDRRKKFPEIEECFHLGKAEADLTISNALFVRAKNGDIASIRWYEMTRMGRSEKQDTTVTSTNYVVEVPAVQSEKAWEEQYSPAGSSDDGSTTDQ